MRVSKRVRVITAALALVGLMTVTMAPAQDMPEQISAAQPQWDRQAQEVVLQIDVSRAALDPGGDCQNCTNKAAVLTEIDVYQDGALIAELRPPPHAIQTRPDALQTPGRLVPIAPQRIPWDRNGGTITGEVILKIELQLVWSEPNRPPSPAALVEYQLLVAGIAL